MRKRRRILLVEDEVMIRRVLLRFFGKEGYETFEADNVKTALDLFRRYYPFDAVICDIYLGPDDGWKIVRFIQHEQPATPVIVTSGAILDGAQPGMNFSILYKPFGPSELMEMLERLWGIRKPTTE